MSYVECLLEGGSFFFPPLPFWKGVVYLEDDVLCTALLGSQDAGFCAEGSKGENEHTGRRDCL